MISFFSLFMHFDTDDSGELDQGELTRLARCLNFATKQGEIECMFRQIDQDNNGTLSAAELCTWLKYNRPNPEALYGLPPYQYNEVLMQFNSFDTNKDGTLSRMEFSSLCIAHGYAKDAAAAQSMFNEIDSDNSGGIDLHEFPVYQRNRQRLTVPPPALVRAAAISASVVQLMNPTTLNTSSSVHPPPQLMVPESIPPSQQGASVESQSQTTPFRGG